MTKDVLVTVKGLQSMEDGSPPEEVEMVAKGEYYYKNGHHYIFYNETIEGFTEQNRNSIKISENQRGSKEKRTYQYADDFRGAKEKYQLLRHSLRKSSNGNCSD